MSDSNNFDTVKYPLVSIVTPSFNSFPYIQETVRSVQTQDYPNVEHIVMDGGSTDGTREFLERQSHLIRVSEPDRGQSHALNKGFHKAKGEIIGWINADDTYCPGAIQFAVQYFHTHPGVDLIYSDVQVIDEKSRKIRIAKAKPFSLELLLIENMVKQPTIFMRRRVVETLGGVDENLHYVMDREFWLRVGFIYKLQYVPDLIFANFRKYPGTKSYEHRPPFFAEWLSVLNREYQALPFSCISKKFMVTARRKAMHGYCLASCYDNLKSGSRLSALLWLLKAITYDGKVLCNRGFWFYLAQIVISPRIVGQMRSRFSFVL